MTMSREPLGPVGHSILENYQALKEKYAAAQARIEELEKQNAALQKRNTELEIEAGQRKPSPPPE